MKRGFLRWFYLAVQFVMLAVSIPKVAMLFHAYDPQTMGPLLGGVDLRSWFVGIAIDLTATVTTWAAMYKFEESRKRTALFAPAFIILVCTGLSVVANYEDAAMLAPAKYANISLFTEPALFVNPILISAPPVLVFLLIVLVPSVLAQPRIRSAGEIAAEAEEQEAQIAASARLREAKARANARVRSAQLSGLADTVGVIAKRAGFSMDAPSGDTGARTEIDNDRAPEPSESSVVSTPSAHVSRAMWNTMSLKERVLKSGIISAQEVAGVLGVSLTRARELVKAVRTSDEEKRTVPGRSGVPFQALIDTLYERRTRDSFAQAQKLVTALGLRRRTRQLQVVTDDPTPDEPTEEDVS